MTGNLPAWKQSAADAHDVWCFRHEGGTANRWAGFIARMSADAYSHWLTPRAEVVYVVVPDAGGTVVLALRSARTLQPPFDLVPFANSEARMINWSHSGPLGRGHTQNFSLFFHFFFTRKWKKFAVTHDFFSLLSENFFTFEVKNFLAVTHKFFH